jgi:LPS O-antigen subunit length determinant protein (WzzB/FepE family)
MNDNIKFHETSRSTSKNGFMTTFRLENEAYTVTMHYMGDYDAEKAAGTLDPGMMSVTILPKKSALLLTAQRNDVSIHDPFLIQIYPEDTDRVIDAIKYAAQSATELQKTIREYLT